MATRRELTKAYAREYQRADKKAKGVMLDELCAATGWSRVNARRAIREATKRKGRAGQVGRKPRPRKYSYDALKVLEQVWTLDGEPCGKYLAPVMDDTLERLLRFRELGKVADRINDDVLAEVRAMSPATIDRYLAPVKAARYPQAKSTTRPGLVLRASIPLRTAMDGFPAAPGYLEIDTVAHCGHRNEGAARGRVWTGADARDLGLVDELGGLRDAVAVARSRAALADDAPVRPALHVSALSALQQPKNSEDPRAAFEVGVASLTSIRQALGLDAGVSLYLAPDSLT